MLLRLEQLQVGRHICFKSAATFEKCSCTKPMLVVTVSEWNSCRLIRRIDVIPKAVWWSPSGLQVAVSAREPLGSATGTNTAGEH